MRARIADCTTASEIAGSSSDLRPGRMPSSQPGKPPAENHCSCTENSRISRIANQKFGMRDADLRQAHHADVAELVVARRRVDAGRQRQHA